MKAKKKKNKGFTRTAKEWEESICGHIGKIIDNLRAKDILDLIVAGTCAFAGWSAAKKLGADDFTALATAGSGILAYRLARAPNWIAGASGVAYLSGLGLICAWNPLTGGLAEVKAKLPTHIPVKIPGFWMPVIA